ncbi:MAG: cupin domain-containing protein [Gemmatimonadetes bacterium]|jgi:quercetin dioxygenase-like cupin family protein|nr:cupin domain-containing protein [Gemmatimonadota bacterium]
MSSLDRVIDGEALVLDLAKEHAQMKELPPDRHGRTARTLLKSGALRITLISLAPGGILPEHAAAGPITVQVIEGTMRFTVDGGAHDLGPGTIVTVGAHVRHAVTSQAGATFLLTVAMPEGAGSGAA